jgi:N-acetyl-anhydromuramyl-L-alanine amidase AmpD
MRRTLATVCISVALAGLLGGSANAAVDAGPPASVAAATRWIPAPATNYTAGRGGERVRLIVIHQTDGTYDGSIAWFGNARSRVSAHYIVRARDGAVTQMVREADTAWHVRGANRTSVGIEHEYFPRLGIGHTDAQYRASASLVCEIARRHGLPIDRQHVVGHNEIPGADHADPGPAWNWAHFMALARGACGSVSSSVTATMVLSSGGGVAPRAGLERGASGEAVLALQRSLVDVGALRQADLQGGPGIFGQLTHAAVVAFQRANGLPQSGYYGPLTQAALARALARSAAPAAVPTADQSGDEVRRLQSALTRLGYMNTVTGYFGPVTRAAVTRFQRDRGVPQTGTFGPLTRAALTRVSPSW